MNALFSFRNLLILLVLGLLFYLLYEKFKIQSSIPDNLKIHFYFKEMPTQKALSDMENYIYKETGYKLNIKVIENQENPKIGYSMEVNQSVFHFAQLKKCCTGNESCCIESYATIPIKTNKPQAMPIPDFIKFLNLPMLINVSGNNLTYVFIEVPININGNI